MNRAELIEEVAERLDKSRKEIADTVDEVVKTIKERVAEGEKVAISGFGIFEQIQRGARTMKSPQDGSTIKVKAKSVPKFKAGAEFRSFVENPRAALKKMKASAKKAPATATAAAKKTTPTATARPSISRPASRARSS